MDQVQLQRNIKAINMPSQENGKIGPKLQKSMKTRGV
jgi:hypothetical protein